MKKIVPFNNVLTFDTAIHEITSISLEHSLEKEVDNLSGVFYISGEYKMLDGGINAEKFNFELPFDIALGACYEMDSMDVDIDDFRYELVDTNKMKVNIDLYIDGEEVSEEINELVKEVPLIKELNLNVEDEVKNERDEVREVGDINEIKDEKDDDKMIDKLKDDNDEVQETLEDEIKREDEIVKELVYEDEENDIGVINNNDNNNIINNFNDEEKYVTYKVYRIADGDTLDSILMKYKVTKEELLSYNENITNLKMGDKLIIPFK